MASTSEAAKFNGIIRRAILARLFVAVAGIAPAYSILTAYRMDHSQWLPYATIHARTIAPNTYSSIRCESIKYFGTMPTTRQLWVCAVVLLSLPHIVRLLYSYRTSRDSLPSFVAFGAVFLAQSSLCACALFPLFRWASFIPTAQLLGLIPCRRYRKPPSLPLPRS